MLNSVENPAEGFQFAFPFMGSLADITEPSISFDVDDSLQHRMYMIRKADQSGLNASFPDLISRINANQQVGGTKTEKLRYFEDDGKTIGFFEASRGDLKRFYHEQNRRGRQRRLKGL